MILTLIGICNLKLLGCRFLILFILLLLLTITLPVLARSLANRSSKIINEQPLIVLLVVLHKGDPLVLTVRQIPYKYFPDERADGIILVANTVVKAVEKVAHVDLFLAEDLVELQKAVKVLF